MAKATADVGDAAVDASGTVRRQLPVVGRDTAFFWEGTARGELLIQRCRACAALRHPPRPICAECHSFAWDTVTSSGRGAVHSYVVHHHPPIPGFAMPVVVVLVDLDEGVRMVGQCIDEDATRVEVGTAVEVTYERVADLCVLPQWRMRQEGEPPRRHESFQASSGGAAHARA